MIDHWLHYAERNPNKYNSFRLIDITEQNDPEDAMLELLGDEIISSYR